MHWDLVASFVGNYGASAGAYQGAQMYQLPSTMKKTDSFVNFCTEKELLMGKRGLFMLMCHRL